MFDETLARIAGALESAGIPYMIIGGQIILEYHHPAFEYSRVNIPPRCVHPHELRYPMAEMIKPSGKSSAALDRPMH